MARAIGSATAVMLALLGVLASAPDALAADRITVVALFKDKALVEIDGKRHLLRQGQPPTAGVRLISATASGAVLEVDGEQGEYALGAGISARFAGPPPRRPLRLYAGSDGVYRAGGSINGRPVQFVIDSGATLVAMNRNQAARLGIDFRAVGQPGGAQTAAGPVATFELTLESVKVGHIELRNVLGSVLESDFPDAILLGNSFLQRLDIERRGGVLELRSRGY